MRPVRLVMAFLRASIQEQTAYRVNFGLHLFSSLLSLATGLIGLQVIFGQVERINGWDPAGTLAVLGVYLLLGALRGLVIGPSLDSLGGMDGEVWQGAFDFTLLRPAPTQFLVSVRKWRVTALVDLLLALAVLGAALLKLPAWPDADAVLTFGLALLAALGVVYAMLLTTAALIFWSPGVLSLWVFDGIFQLARYPLDLYPGWLKLVLTWVIPVGVITTLPAEALAGALDAPRLGALLLGSAVLVVAASLLFRAGLRRYGSASS